MNAKAADHKSSFPWLLMALAVLALAVLIALGSWQVQRLAWKEDLIATIQARLAAAPSSIADVAARAAAGDDIRYQPVTVSGLFLHDREQHFFATFRGASGFYIYTPLQMADGRMVLVNRGFVPFDLKAPETRAEGQVDGVVTVSGLARERLDGKPSFIVPDNDPDQNIYYWKDWGAMVMLADLEADAVLPFFVDADDAPNPGGWPAGGVTRIDLPNNHLQYAVTWYGLAVTLVIIVGLFVRRRMKGPSTN